MIAVRLNAADMAWANKVGEARWARVKRNGSKAKFAGATMERHLEGARGELAFCRALGLVWPASDGTYLTAPDVWPNWEIRTSPSMQGVKVVDTDPEHRLVAWVAGGRVPYFEVKGYIRAGGAKRHRDWYDDPGNRGRPIWLVPPARMIPIDPDFHSVHAYTRSEIDGRWECAFCPVNVGS